MPVVLTRHVWPLLLGALLFGFAVPGAHASSWQRGANLTAYSPHGYGTAAADASLERLAAAGNDSVAILVTWYQPTARSSAVAAHPALTPTDASLLHAMAKARSLGLAVTLKPHVNVHDGTWRGAIQPADRAAWFVSYKAMIAHYASLAADGGASMFVVGTELKTMSTDTARWQDIVADVRSRFAGKVTYAANYNEFERIGFWGRVDYIGVDAYFALTNDTGDSAGTLAWRWTLWGWKTRLVTAAFTWNKPVVFTELGYRSTPHAARRPGDWATPGPVDRWAQQQAYEAFYRAFESEGWFSGVFWWNWPAELPKSGGWDSDYPPIDKPAEQTIRSWNARLAAEPRP